jgi:hypothetical protein
VLGLAVVRQLSLILAGPRAPRAPMIEQLTPQDVNWHNVKFSRVFIHSNFDPRTRRKDELQTIE